MSSLKSAASTIFENIPNERCGSAFVITAVGSLEDVTLRLANASRGGDGDGNDDDVNHTQRYRNKRFEIVSLTGTFGRYGGCHVHISLADAKGYTVGGHLVDGVVFTTCELVLGTAIGVEFVREMDPETGYKELEVRQLFSRSLDSTTPLSRVSSYAMAAMSFFWCNVLLWKIYMIP